MSEKNHVQIKASQKFPGSTKKHTVNHIWQSYQTAKWQKQNFDSSKRKKIIMYKGTRND